MSLQLKLIRPTVFNQSIVVTNLVNKLPLNIVHCFYQLNIFNFLFKALQISLAGKTFPHT